MLQLALQLCRPSSPAATRTRVVEACSHRPARDNPCRVGLPSSGASPETAWLHPSLHWGEGLFVRPRKTQTVAAPGSGTLWGLIRTLRAGRTIAPTLNSVYGLGRLRGQNLVAPVSDGEIAPSCETTSRDRSHTMCEGRTCLTWTLACESASGTHASPQCLRSGPSLGFAGRRPQGSSR